MKKKLLLASVAAMLVMCFTFSAAFAATDKQLDRLYKMVDKANDKIEKAVEKAQKTEADDVEELLTLVDEIVDPVFAYAASIGYDEVTVVCEYDTYWIDGRWVDVDPLRVVNVGSGTGGNN